MDGGRNPGILLTTEPITTVEQAWQIVYASVRRWQIEPGSNSVGAIRCGKSELAMEGPRVWGWKWRRKFLRLAALAYFSFCRLRDDHQPIRHWSLRY